MSNLIKIVAGMPSIVTADAWQVVRLPEGAAEAVKKQAGKVVLFRLTGAETATAEQLTAVAIPAQGPVLLPFCVWQAQQTNLAARAAAGEVAVYLETHELVEALAETVDNLNVFPLLAIHIERFADGRAYSAAALLRNRYGFTGELRAMGDVLQDQLFFMRRCGFDAFQIRADRSASAAVAAFADFSEPYQGASHISEPVWRRYART